MTHNNLGIAYAERTQGDHAKNLEWAMRHFGLALQVHTHQAYPTDWAMIQNNLGNAYRRRIRGDRGENLERAIGHYERALMVFTRQSLPADWAMTQNNLGNAYRRRIRGDQGENLEQAIRHYELALEVFTRRSFPADWAMTQNNLAAVYRDRIQGDRGQNSEQAIEHYHQSLKVYTRRAFPLDWAMIQNNLGTACRTRIQGERRKNEERAIGHFTRALRVFTRQALPVDWAMVQTNLGNAQRERTRGSREKNIERALGHYANALEIFTCQTFPANCRHVATSLGDLLFSERRWCEAVAPLDLALRAAQSLYEASLLRDGKEGELAETGDLHRRTAYALARAGKAQAAVLALERWRARRLSEALARDRADLESVRLRAPEVYAAYQRATEGLQALEMRLQEMDFSLRERGPRLAREELGREAEQLHAQLSAAIEGIRHLPDFRGFLKQAEFVDITDAVAADAPLVYLVTTSAGSLALILFRASPSAGLGCEAVWADAFTQSDLQSLLQELESGGTAGGYLEGQLQNTPLLKLSLDKLLPVLGSELLSPVTAKLAELGFQQMLLIPCGYLGLLPLHAALCGENSNAFHLLERFTVAYGPSARALPIPLAGSAEQDTPTVLVGVGNPSPTSHRPLLFSRTELEEVGCFFDTFHPLYEGGATKVALLQALDGATYVHLSCHGAFSPDNALDSCLLLAHNETLSLRDMLYGEARTLLKQVRLVVLSACQSAIAEFSRLPDEVTSLQAGFLQAGARGVIGTLWQVEDMSTALLMAKFYEYHLVGNIPGNQPPMAPAKALACAQSWLRTVTARELRDSYWRRKELDDLQRPAAQQQMSASVALQGIIRFSLQDPESRPFAHPYYWAPFVLFGR